MTTFAAPGATADITEAERAVLGEIITSRDVAEHVLATLARPDDWSSPQHAQIAAAVAAVIETGGPHTAAAILAALLPAGGVWRTTGAAALLASYAAAAGRWAEHVPVITRAAIQRRTVAACAAAGEAAAAPGFDPDEHGEAIRAGIEEALSGPDAARPLPSAGELFTATMDWLDDPAPPGLVTPPWASLAGLIPFLQPGQLVAVLARPSHGKSITAQAFARHTALTLGLPVILFSPEMSERQVMARLLAADTGIAHDRLVRKELDDRAWGRLAEARERFEAAPLYVDGTSAVTLAHARARVRGMTRAGMPPALVIVDYLQLMAPDPARRWENRQAEVGALTAGLKELATDHQVPVLACIQLNRGPENRPGRRPQLSDARESGAVDGHADVAILVHRPGFRDPSRASSDVELIVDKHRDGRRGSVLLSAQDSFSRFADREPDLPPPPAWMEAEEAAQARRDDLASRRARRQP